MADLNARTLATIQSPVSILTYDRRRVTVGIVHFGVGAFHRAHEAMYIDRVLRQDPAAPWGICGVGLLPFDIQVREALRDQDCLYTLVTKSPNGTAETRVIGSILDYLYAPDDPEAVLHKLTAPSTRIVSLTITEGGYLINEAGSSIPPRLTWLQT